MGTLKLLFVDQDMNTAEVEIDGVMFRQLKISSENIKQHRTKKDLYAEITEFLKKSNENT